MPNVVITGGPGSGKTTLLAELASLGHVIVSESAREIIAERRSRGLGPRPSPLEFAREILRRDAEKYRCHSPACRYVFFDRGVVEALAMVHRASPLAESELSRMLGEFAFHPVVFILPPWEAIYRTDAERDQSFGEAIDVYTWLCEWYKVCGYTLHEVPSLSPRERAQHVLEQLAPPCYRDARRLKWSSWLRARSLMIAERLPLR
jgi:predicted ATPase